MNNWNEEREEAKIEQKLLISLQREIQANITELEIIIDRQTRSSELNKELLAYFSSIGKSYDVVYLDYLVENASHPSFFSPQMGVVKSIISTGEINFIRNEHIVGYVSMFEDKCTEVMKQFDRLTNIWSEQLWPRENLYIRRLNRVQENKKSWFKFDLPPSKSSSDYDNFFSDVVLENIYMLMLYDQISLIGKEEVLLDQMQRALKLVHSELNKKES